jgi:hypothetical protein
LGKGAFSKRRELRESPKCPAHLSFFKGAPFTGPRELLCFLCLFKCPLLSEHLEPKGLEAVSQLPKEKESIGYVQIYRRRFILRTH